MLSDIGQKAEIQEIVGFAREMMFPENQFVVKLSPYKMVLFLEFIWK